MSNRQARGSRNRHRWLWSSGSKGITFGAEIPTLFQWIAPDDQSDRAGFLAQAATRPAIPGAGEAGQGARTGHDEAEADVPTE